jgi:predicted small lipoprotein YifL
VRPKSGRTDYTLPCAVHLYFEKNLTFSRTPLENAQNFFIILSTIYSKVGKLYPIRGAMNKKIIPSIFLLTIFTLAACGGSAPASPLDVEPAAPAPAESQPTATSAPVEEAITEEAAPTEEATSPEIEAGSSSVSFENDVRPILDAKCIRCHGVQSTREGLDMLNYTNLMKGSRNGSVVTPGNAEESLLVELVAQGEMPSRGEKVTPDELQLIIEWINQGALNN